MKPKCIIVIPYYNDGGSLVRSLDSIGTIDSAEAEIIVVDDGSCQLKAVDVLSSYCSPLPINLISLEKNKGIEHALNEALKTFGRNCEYIARLDCGDTCKNNRINKQINFLQSNPTVDLLGSWVDFTDIKGNFAYTLRQPETAQDIKKAMFLNAAFTHPAVMFRSRVIDSVGLYPTSFPAAEDYAYFFKIIKKHNVYNIQESLVDCVINPGGISNQKRKTQIQSRIKIILENFDFSPIAFYGLFRSLFLLYTPRGFTVVIKKFLKS